MRGMNAMLALGILVAVAAIWVVPYLIARAFYRGKSDAIRRAFRRTDEALRGKRED